MFPRHDLPADPYPAQARERMTKHTVRASSLSSYADCPRRWMARQSHQLVQDAGYALNSIGRHIGAATGQATHQGSLSGLRARLKTGTFDPEAMDDVAISTLREETEGQVIWDDRSPNINTAEKQVIRQVHVFRDSVLPDDESEWIEPEWKGMHHTGLEVTGHPDLVKYDLLSDVKTGIESDNAAQYGCYVMLSWNAPEKPQLDHIHELFIPRTKITAPAPELDVIKYDLEGCVAIADATLTKIARALGEFEKEGRNAFLANTRSMLCSNTFCAAWGTSFCPESTLSKRKG